MILFAFHLAPFAFQDLDKKAHFGAFSLLISAPNDPGLKSSRKWNLKVIAIKLTNE